MTNPITSLSVCSTRRYFRNCTIRQTLTEQELLQAIADSDGDDDVVIYLRDIKNIKILPQNLQVKADGALMEKLTVLFGKENVKFITKPIENRSKID